MILSKHITVPSDSHRYDLAWEEMITVLPDTVIYLDTTHIIRSVNPAFTQMFGYLADEIIGKNAMELHACPWYFHQQVELRFNTHSKQPPGIYETDYRRKNGDTFTAKSIAASVKDSSGQIIGFTLLIRDDTENRQIESDYTRLATAVDQATENVIITDPEGRIQYVNPSFEKTTGYKKEEVLGHTPAILKSGAHDENFYKDIWRTITSGNPWSGQIKNKRKDGSLYTEDCIITPVFSESGKTINFVGVKHDITRTLELEEQNRQAQRIESLGRLAGGVAHDINNLLFPILGFTDILLEDIPKTSLLHEPVEEIRKAGTKIRNLIRQLLAFSRKQTLEIGPLNLNHVIKGFEKLLRKTIRDDVDMDIWLDDHLPLILADEGQIEQIIMNLVVNAQNAMPGGGRLMIETGTQVIPDPKALPDTGKRESVYIRISDTGCGMDRRTRSRIFEPFFTTRSDTHGTGLGLATVYGIVRQHQGHIDVESEPDKGTSFTVYLPASKESGSQAAIGKEQYPKKHSIRRLQQKKVLIAEDNPLAKEFVQRALSRLGYDVVMAGDAVDCKTFLQTYDGSLDLLLSDVIMPKINGKELQQHVHELFPDLKTLFMSGYPQDVIARHGNLEQGLNFLAKPFSQKQLSEKLSAIL